jgi:hypothetical protein
MYIITHNFNLSIEKQNKSSIGRVKKEDVKNKSLLHLSKSVIYKLFEHHHSLFYKMQ